MIAPALDHGQPTSAPVTFRYHPTIATIQLNLVCADVAVPDAAEICERDACATLPPRYPPQAVVAVWARRISASRNVVWQPCVVFISIGRHLCRLSGTV